MNSEKLFCSKPFDWFEVSRSTEEEEADMRPEDLDRSDPDYQVIITIRAVRRGRSI